MLLKDKKAIVTGGARGIGLEITKTFLKEGASVYIVDLMESDQMGALQELASSKGATVALKTADVSNEESVNKVAEEILSEAGSIEILVNNAGITRDNLLFRMSKDEWDKVLNINLTSAFLMSKALARKMMKQKQGSIINMASVVGVGGNAGQCNYSASKAGMIGFTKSLSKEISSRNVRVNAIAPGYIITDMTHQMTEEAKEAMLSQIPMKRGGTPEEVAAVALFLASDLSSYVTGRVIQVDGGMAI